MEPRAAIGDFDPSSGDYTLYTTSQNPHVIRLLMGAFVLHIPENKLRVVAPDVGGGFGSKIYHYAEEAIVTWAAGKLRRPVKWTAERNESFVSDAHGRDHVSTAEMAIDKDGHFLALRVNTLANMGAYLSTFAPCVPTYLYAHAAGRRLQDAGDLLRGESDLHQHRAGGRLSRRRPAGGDVPAGAPGGRGGHDTGIDRVELRRRNFIPRRRVPVPDAGRAADTTAATTTRRLNGALAAADYAGFEARRRGGRGARQAAWHRRIHLSRSVRHRAVGGGGLARRPRGAVRGRQRPRASDRQRHGLHRHAQPRPGARDDASRNSSPTQLGVPIAQVDIVHGDTAKIPFGMGTYGSRSLAVGGTAMVKAMDKVIAKGKKIAAHLMEASVDDIEFKDDKFTVAGTDKAKTLAEISLAAYVPHNYPIEELEPGLDETAFYDPTNFTFPGGCHVCEVEIDPDTGAIAVVNFVAVDDVGRVINPMIVEGQVQGGVAQGIGQALLENAVYDSAGELLSGSFMDYTMPRADNLPNIRVATEITLCTHNPLGVKGCGEVGAIGSPPAVINAVVDALKDYGVRHIDMPASAPKDLVDHPGRPPAMAAE